MLYTKEHYELIAVFEKEFKGQNTDSKTPKKLWEKGAVFDDGRRNELYRAYLSGYMLGKAVERDSV